MAAELCSEKVRSPRAGLYRRLREAVLAGEVCHTDPERVQDGFLMEWGWISEDHRGTPDAPGRVVTLIDRGFWESLGDEVRK